MLYTLHCNCFLLPCGLFRESLSQSFPVFLKAFAQRLKLILHCQALLEHVEVGFDSVALLFVCDVLAGATICLDCLTQLLFEFLLIMESLHLFGSDTLDDCAIFVNATRAILIYASGHDSEPESLHLFPVLFFLLALLPLFLVHIAVI